MKGPPEFAISDAHLTGVTVANDLRSVKAPEHALMDALHKAGYDKETIFAIKLAFEEAVTNAVKHGNRNDRSKHVHIRFFVDPTRVIIGVADEGPGFSPDAVPDPTADENLERPCGRGIMLMSAYMDKVCYCGNGNEVWMLKEVEPHHQKR